MKPLSKLKEERVIREYKKAFPKDFYLWSELGWWIKTLHQAVLEAKKESYLAGKKEGKEEQREFEDWIQMQMPKSR
jgi:hypothetical protein